MGQGGHRGRTPEALVRALGVAAPVLAAVLALAAPAVSGAAPVSDAQARSDLAALITNVSTATAVSYQTHDSAGDTVDTMKVIQIGPSSYVGVYHHEDAGGYFSARVATSTDLLHWTFQTTLDFGAGDPYIAAVPGGGYLVAVEQGNDPPLLGLVGTVDSHLVFLYYANETLLLAGVPTRIFSAPRSLSSDHEGTPSLDSITLRQSLLSSLLSPLLGLDPLSNSTIQVGFHYHDTAAGVDRNAIGTLTNFSSWTEQINTTLNSAFPPSVKGNIGARDTLTFEGYPFSLVEGQSTPRDFGSFAIYLYDPTANYLQRVTPMTASGSEAFGNPRLTLLTDPAGKPALLVSLFVFLQRSFGNEAGPLLYYHEL
jgi:hypothetical protein